MAAQIILFEQANCHGGHKHEFLEEANLAAGDDAFFNDRISSFVVVEGARTFWRDVNFSGPDSGTFGPGVYNWVEAVGIPDDSVSSVFSTRH